MRIFILFFLLFVKSLSIASSDVCDDTALKKEIKHLCEVQMKAECDEFSQSFTVVESYRKLRDCSDDSLVLTAANSLKGCVSGAWEAAYDALLFVPTGMGALWDSVKRGTEEKREFYKKCETEPDHKCKLNLMSDVPSLKGVDPAKTSLNDILQKRDYYIRLSKSYETYGRSKTLSQRAADIEEYEAKLEKEPYNNSGYTEADLKTAGLKALEQQGVKWNCYNSRARSEMLCYAASSVAIGGLAGKVLLEKALKIAGKTKVVFAGKKELEFLKNGELVDVHIKDSIDVRSLSFQKFEDGKAIFKDGTGADVVLKESEIAEIRGNVAGKLSKKPESVQEFNIKNRSQYEKAMSGFANGVFLGKGLSVKSLKKVVDRDNLTVLSSVRTDKAVVHKLVQQVDEMDKVVTDLGFRVPSTRILINDSPMLPSITGPFSMASPAIHLRDLKLAENTIAMKPILYRTEAAVNDSVMLHERTHSVLFATYKSESYVNSNRAVQEAFADYLAADLKNNPAIGIGASAKDRAIRNIETREAGGHVNTPGMDGAVSRSSIMDIDASSFHKNSMLYSNALWRVRNAIGPEEMKKNLKPIIDGLNEHRSSAMIAGRNATEVNRADFQYFLASARKTLQERGQVRAVAEIDTLSQELSMGTSKIKDQAASLKRDTKTDFKYKSGQGSAAIVTYHMGVGARLTAEGYILYNVIKNDDP